MGGRRCKTSKASESYTKSPPNPSGTPKNKEIVLGREPAEEGGGRKCRSAPGGGGGGGGGGSVVTAKVGLRDC